MSDLEDEFAIASAERDEALKQLAEAGVRIASLRARVVVLAVLLVLTAIAGMWR